MGLSRRDLAEGEDIVVEVRGHRGALLAPLVLTALCCIAAGAILLDATALPLRVRQGLAALVVLMPVLWLLARAVRWRSRTISLTNERIVAVEGLGRRRTDQIRLERVLDVVVLQSLVGRVLNRGDLRVDLIDGSPILIDAVRHPAALQRLIMRQLAPQRPAGSLVVDVPPGGPGGVHDPRSSSILPPAVRPRLITELDPTPPRGTPAVSAPAAASVLARLDEIDQLEAEGLLSAEEAARRRTQLQGMG